ncbi:MAG: hypothetical protein DCF15_06185 [Phormidesmis priestleyi]|uniref:CHAT domain-containing protein n=1 Tax=Phormidesmis priestleyi TaxID=268141 RepID=A0A2W4XLP3_9CYAN|nr:MAG: hypothetical protein DCF15_06185 [Phormidesmis priestleyi]
MNYRFQLVKLLGLLATTLVALPITQASGFAQQSPPRKDVDSAELKQAQTVPNQSDFTQGTLGETDTVFADTLRRFDAYSFEGVEGETIRITVTSEDFVPVIWLIDESTEEVIGHQTADAETVSIAQQLHRDGTYIFRVSSSEMIGEGDYRVRVVSIQEASGTEAEAHRLSDQGNNQFELGQFEAAIAFWEQALQLYVELEDRAGESSILGSLGVAYKELGDYEKAIDLHQQALEISIEVNDKLLQARSLNNLGVTYKNQDEYLQAIIAFERSLELAEETNNPEKKINALLNLADVHKLSGNYQQSINYYEEVVSTLQEVDNINELSFRADLTEIRANVNFGELHISQENYLRSIQFFQESLRLISEIEESDTEIANDFTLRALNGLAIAHRNLGNYQQAVNYLEKVINTSRVTDDLSNLSSHDNLARIRANFDLGELHAAQGSHSQSIQFFQESLRLISEFGGSDTKATNHFTFWALARLGMAHRNLGNYQLSLKFFSECLQLARQTGDFYFESVALTNTGNVYANLGNSRRAREYYEQALTSEFDILDSAHTGQILRNLGGIYTQLGDYQEAKGYYEQGLEIARELEDQQGIVSALVGLNEISNTRGNGIWIFGLQDEALVIARNSITDLALRASVLRSIGNSFNRIRDNDSGGMTIATNSIDIDLLEEALTLYENADALDKVANTRTDLARAYLRLDQPKIAEEHLMVATQIYDSLRTDNLADADRISLFQGQVDAFSLLQEALTEQDKFEAALVAAERGRARALAALLSQQESIRSLDIAAGSSPDITGIQRIAQQTESTLVTYSIIRDVDQNYDWNRFFSGYGVGYEFNYSLYIWVTSPNGTIAFRQVPLTGIDLSNLVADSRQAMGVRRDRGGFELADPEKTPAQVEAEQNEKLRQLHDVLIDPISDLLPTDPNQPVVFIPQDELFLVPFPALKDDNGNYLIEKHTILTAPSIQVLQLTYNLAESRGDTTITNPVIVGDPVMPSTTFMAEEGDFKAIRLSSLPGARQEAQAVSAFLNSSALIGEAATEATVKQQLPTADLIHLATHGLLEYGDPQETGTRDLPGAIALAPGGNEDGLLTSAEILQMDLKADLVVLSACDTGRGRITGDGVIGLSRSFVAAGVPSIIVSLWSVPDAPTAELMTKFYQQLEQGQTKAQALRQAMLATMQSHPNPVDWAAFTLIGAAE